VSLFIISTPIGNLEDITIRALDVLKTVDLILAEDTRHTKILLDKYQIKNKLASFHQHSSEAKINFISNELASGKEIALVSDAGTPGISDPGQYLIKKLLEVMPELKIVSIPGPSALIAALSISGFNTSDFIFLGFLPKKKGFKTLTESLANESRTMVFYESPNRINRVLADLSLILGQDRNIVVARELTKKFEEITRGKIGEIAGKLKEKGEFVVVIEGKK
jgi:16S rRNA (cytidine1402-2'-O)-methyltransferase